MRHATDAANAQIHMAGSSDWRALQEALYKFLDTI